MEGKENLWHTLTQEELFAHFESRIEGLSEREVEERLLKYGENILESKKKSNWPKILLSQFRSPLIYILIVSAFITYSLRDPVDTGVILAVVVFNGLLGFIQEYRADKVIDSLKKLSISYSAVIRENKIKKIQNNLLAPGDIIEVETGKIVPTDIRLLESHNIEVNQSVITGESLPVKKNSNRLNIQKPLAERTNLIYSGSVITNGKGLGIIIATGPSTILGEISKNVRELPESKTPLQIKMAKFGQIILMLVVLAAVAIFLIGVAKGMNAMDIFLTSVSLAVAVIPEGLPAITAIALTGGAHLLGQKGALVKRLTAVETLGSANLILTDKTGTLTENKMFLEKIYAGTRLYHLSGEDYSPSGNFYAGKRKINPHHNPKLTALLQAAILCNDAKLIYEKPEWKVIGDPTEGALLVAAQKAEIKKNYFERYFPRIDALPFSPHTHFMATLHRGKKYDLVLLKGSPEVIVSLSRLGKTKRAQIEKIHHQMAMDELRVLAIAQKKLFHPIQKLPGKNLDKTLGKIEFLGLVGIWDPPRPEAEKAVQTAQKAGIRVAMITGDHPLTAFKISQKTGIISEKEIYLEGKNVITGKTLDELEGGELDQILEKINVFARVSPDHKLRLVQAFQKKGYVTGVTGDGVNDAMSLKVADIGIAMGKAGTDIAREASDMVLVDDNFATIVEIIRRGRNILQNIRRATLYLLSTNIVEAIVIGFALLFSWPLPFLPSQILLINLLTDGATGAALAFEPDHENQLKYPPKNPSEGILDRLMTGRILLVGAVISILTLIIYHKYLGGNLSQARTIAFAVLSCAQIVNVFNSRSFTKSIFQIPFFSNKFVLFAVLTSFLGMILVVQEPFLSALFHFQPLNFLQWLTAILLSVFVIIAVEIEKWWRESMI